MLTTSGSTGVPKIVPLPDAAVTAFLTWAAETFAIASGVRVLSYAPLNFDLSLLDVWATLASGATAVLVDPAHATDPESLARTVIETGVNVVQSVPMTFRLLAEARSHDGDFAQVRHVLLTGEAMPAVLLAELPRLFPAARFYNVYGCTETNDSTMHEITTFAGDVDAVQPIGRPLPGVLVRVVDQQGEVLSGPGEGELWVHTPFQTAGYLDPELNRERFVPDPLGSAEIFYRSGDLVRRDAHGLLWLAGRQDHQVKIRGVRTNLAEVEHVVQGHPDVLEAAVVAVPDDDAGHLLHAVVRRRPGSSLNSLLLREECMRRLPGTAIPSTISFVADPLPRTSTGKINRNLIRASRDGGK